MMSVVVANLTAEEANFVRSAVKEWKAIKQGREFSGWMKIGAALAIGRRVCLIAAGTNRPEGGAYNRAFSAWCKNNGFINPEIDAPTRSHLLYLTEPEHRHICDELRMAMATSERLKINHPAAMVRRVRAYLRDRDGDIGPKRAPSKKSTPLRQQLLETEQRLAEAEERAAQDIDLDAVAVAWVGRASAEGIARVMVGADADKAKATANAILARLAEEEPAPKPAPDGLAPPRRRRTF